MTPKKKAKQLLEKVRPHTQYWDCYNDCPLEENHAQKVALICANEIKFTNVYGGELLQKQHKEYWQKVKDELENL